MIDEILINVGPREVRAALIEDERVIELEIWRRDRADLLGRVYLGRVERLAPGMQAAFVDLGLARSGFLAARDVREAAPGGEVPPDESTPIASRLEEGQGIVVQITKEPIADKGTRLTMDLTLPGRYLAFRPRRRGVALSRRIRHEAERARLLTLGEALADDEGGFILRTAAEGAEAAALQSEAEALRRSWRRIDAAARRAKAPTLLHSDDDPVRQCLRDHLYPAVARVVIDEAEALARARAYAAETMPWAAERLVRHDGGQALFELYDTEAEIEAALERRRGLPSGGSISIEASDALTAIDVNSGRYTDGRDPEETALRTNLEAAAEIARQLRLRAIGGLIVIDFIHMNGAGAVARVLAALDAALARDRAPTRRAEMSSFGLVEMTRRRLREPLAVLMTEPCPSCAGGRRPTARAVADQALRLVEREARRTPGGRIEIVAAPAVIADLGGEASGLAEALGRRLGCRLSLLAAPERGRESFAVYRP